MPRPSSAQQENVVIPRELHQILQGEKEHGAGSASPKDRGARPSASLLANHSVLDNSQDGDYVPGKRASPTRKPRASTGGAGTRARLRQMASLTWDTLSALTSLPPSPTATVTTVPTSADISQYSPHLNSSAPTQRMPIQRWQRGISAGSGKIYPLLSPAPSFFSPPGAFHNNSRRPRLAAHISRVQKLSFVAVAGVVVLFVLVKVWFGVAPWYNELDIAARTTAERMEALHLILDDKLESCYVFTSVILHILIDILRWAVAHFTEIVFCGTTMFAACAAATWYLGA